MTQVFQVRSLLEETVTKTLRWNCPAQALWYKAQCVTGANSQGKHDSAEWRRRKLAEKKIPSVFCQVSSQFGYKQVRLQRCEVIPVWLSPLSEPYSHFNESPLERGGGSQGCHIEMLCLGLSSPLLSALLFTFSWNGSSHNIKGQKRKQRREYRYSLLLKRHFTSYWGHFLRKQNLGKLDERGQIKHFKTETSKTDVCLVNLFASWNTRNSILEHLGLSYSSTSNSSFLPVNTLQSRGGDSSST